MCEQGHIESHHLPDYIRGKMAASTGLEDMASIDKELREIEKGMILEALRRAEGVQVKAAKILGINQRSLWHRIKKYNINAREFKSAFFDETST
jgi:transcriptional regulator with PAS, ATPase and Fis domain